MKDKRKTLDKKVDNFKLKKIAKKQKLQEKGITLVALVVTIIILLILAGVTLNIALSDNGLFSKAKKAAEDYKEAQSEEEDLISQIATQMYSEYVGATVEGYNMEQKSVTIEGTTSGLSDNKDDSENAIDGIEENGKQTFTTETEMKWRVWDYDGNTLRIIGEPTEKKLYLKGAAGYNNGVWAINNICNTLYSNGKIGVSATNLKRSDIQKVSTYDYTKYKHNQSNSKEELGNRDENYIYFGETLTYGKEKNLYPDMWNENDKYWDYEFSKDNGMIGKDKECKTWEAIGKYDGKMNGNLSTENNSKNFKQSFYEHNYNNSEFINTTYFDLIFNEINGDGNGVWLLTRCICLFSAGCNFDLRGNV